MPGLARPRPELPIAPGDRPAVASPHWPCVPSGAGSAGSLAAWHRALPGHEVGPAREALDLWSSKSETTLAASIWADPVSCRPSARIFEIPSIAQSLTQIVWFLSLICSSNSGKALGFPLCTQDDHRLDSRDEMVLEQRSELRDQRPVVRRQERVVPGICGLSRGRAVPAELRGIVDGPRPRPDWLSPERGAPRILAWSVNLAICASITRSINALSRFAFGSAAIAWKDQDLFVGNGLSLVELRILGTLRQPRPWDRERPRSARSSASGSGQPRPPARARPPRLCRYPPSTPERVPLAWPSLHCPSRYWMDPTSKKSSTLIQTASAPAPSRGRSKAMPRQQATPCQTRGDPHLFLGKSTLSMSENLVKIKGASRSSNENPQTRHVAV